MPYLEGQRLNVYCYMPPPARTPHGPGPLLQLDAVLVGAGLVRAGADASPQVLALPALVLALLHGDVEQLF
jgi:hypothetical protein